MESDFNFVIPTYPANVSFEFDIMYLNLTFFHLLQCSMLMFVHF